MLTNYISLVYAYLAGIAAKAIVMIIVARSLGVSAFGTLSFAISYVSLFLVISDLGLRQFTTTEVARMHGDDEEVLKHANNVLSAKLLLSVLSLLLMVGAGYLLGYDHQTVFVIAAMAISNLCLSFMQLIRAFFAGKDQMHYEAFIASIDSTLVILAVVIATSLNANLYVIVVAWAAAMIAAAMLSSLIFQRRIGTPAFTLRHDALSIVTRSFFFGFAPYMATVYMNLDTVLIGSLIGNEQAGLYQAGFRLVFTSVFLAANFMRTLYPMLSRTYTHHKHALEKLLRVYHTLGFVLCAPILLFFVMFSSETITLVYGPEYLEADVALQLLSIAFLISYWPPSWTVLPAMDTPRDAFMINGAGMVVSAVLNVLLIPTFGMVAAAWVSVITMLVVKILVAVSFARRELPMADGSLMCAAIVAWCLLLGLLCRQYFSAWGVMVCSGIYISLYIPGAYGLISQDIVSLRRFRTELTVMG